MAQGNRIVKFSVFKDQKLVEEHSFEKDEVLVGAFARADLRLDDEAIERRHVVLRVAGDGGVTIENLAGEGRVKMNGADVAAVEPVKSGDQIDVGPYRLLVSVREPGATEGVSGFYDRKEERHEPGSVPALEVAMFWEGSLLAVNHYPKVGRISIGEKKGSTYFAPEERIGEDQYDLIVPRGDKFAVNLSNDKIEGDILIRDKIYTVPELKAAGLLTDGQHLRLDEHTRCRLTMGNISFLVSYAMLPPKPKTALFGRVSLNEHIYTSISLIAHVLFLIILSLIPEEQLVAQRDPHRSRNRTFQVMKMAAEEKKEDQEEEKKEEKKEEDEDKEKGKEEKEGTQQDEETKVEEEVVKKPTVTKDTSRRPSDEMASKLSPTKLREYNRQVATSTGVSKVFNQQTDIIQDMMGGGAGLWGGRSRGLRVLMSKGQGGEAAGGYWTGSGGLDPFGGSTGGPGGGGFVGTALAATVGGPAGPGTEDIAGLGKGDGKAGTKIKLKDRRQKVVVTSAAVSITGGLDKATIQRYIRSKMGQIRWCYKNELQKNKDLKGKITVEFVIAPTGKVMTAKIAGSTMGNKQVEGCIRQKVAMWRFPASKQGSAARVRYPFIFKAL